MFDPFSAGFEWDDGMMNLAKRNFLESKVQRNLNRFG